MNIDLDENRLYQLMKRAISDVLDEKLAKMNRDFEMKSIDLKALFKETQNLPQSKLITEEEIEAEILAYREGK